MSVFNTKLGQTLKVLIVEDDTSVRQTYMLALRQTVLFKPNVVAATTKEEALDLIHNQKYDCLLLDYELPDGTGLEIIAEIKQKPLSERPAMIMVTSHDDYDLAMEALQAGAQDFISKCQGVAQELPKAVVTAVHNVRQQRAALKE